MPPSPSSARISYRLATIVPGGKAEEGPGTLEYAVEDALAELGELADFTAAAPAMVSDSDQSWFGKTTDHLYFPIASGAQNKESTKLFEYISDSELRVRVCCLTT
jgi:hypothetical protein